MKIYIDENDIAKTVTYKEENGKRQYLYIHDNEGFIFKELSEHDKQVRQEVCEEIKEKVKNFNKVYLYPDYTKSDAIECILDDVEEILEQTQGE
jgi:Holliday junction resolvase